MLEIFSGKKQRAPRVVVYGPEGIGKTTFAAQFPRPLFIDTENGTVHLDVDRTKRPETWSELLSIVSEIRKNAMGYKTLVVDTMDWAQRLAATQMCQRLGVTGIEDVGYGRGYTYLVEDVGKLLDALTELNESGMNVVITAHAMMRKFEQPDEAGAYDRWELKLEKKISLLVKEWADMVLFANYKTMVIIDDKTKKAKGYGADRIMSTTHAATWDAKNRHGLSDELPFEFKAISHLFDTTVPTPVAVPTQTKPVATPVVPVPTEKSAHDKLRALMKINGISDDELMGTLVAFKYYPAGTAFEALDDETILRRMIPAWEKTRDAVLKRRNDKEQAK